MTEFWLISAPGEKTCQQTWDKLMLATTRPNNLSANNKFNIPDLKVRQDVTSKPPIRFPGFKRWCVVCPKLGGHAGCFGGPLRWTGQTGHLCWKVNDSSLSHWIFDSDAKPVTSLCAFLCASVVKKVAQYMADVLEDSRDKVQENLLANGGNGGRSPHSLVPVGQRQKEACRSILDWLIRCAINIYGWTVPMEMSSCRWFVLPSAVDLVTYITRFQWDMAKYPIKQSLKNISEIISKVSRLWQTLLATFA